ncbi:MAG: trigger factor [Lachnospiraceae bacterium]|nr:trigger factor [Lachnospiraceae bacterium]
MKKIFTAVLVICMCLALAGCSSKENPVTGYKKGDVTLGQYKGLSYTKQSIEVTDEDIENKIKSDLNSRSERVEITDRPVQNGDIVNIDFVGKIDGVAFDNGSASGQELTIGSGRMIPGFEEEIIGFNTGESKTISVSFPEDYTNAELAGKPATFDITVNKIYENVVPELTEEFVKEKLSYDSIDAYRAAVKSSLEETAKEDAEQQKFNDVIAAAVNNATFNKDLSSDIAKAKENLIKNYDSMAQSYYNVDAKTLFAALYGMSEDQFDQAMESQAQSNTKYNYMLSAVIEAEKISASEDEILDYANSLLADYGVASADELYKLITENAEIDGKTLVTEQVKLNKASDVIVNSAVEAQ